MIHPTDLNNCNHYWVEGFMTLPKGVEVCVRCFREREKPERTPIADLVEGWYPVRYMDVEYEEGDDGWFVVFIYGAAPFFQFNEFVEVERPMEFGPRIEMPRG
jgi:hypothetical protein